MAPSTPNYPPHGGGGRKIALQRVPSEEETEKDPPEHEKRISAVSEAEDKPETLTGDERDMIMNFVEIFGGLAQKMMDGPFDIPMDELRIRGLSAQAELSETSFKHSGESRDIEKAAECRSQALSLTPDGLAGRAFQLGTFGTALLRKFERLGELADIDRAIQSLSQALQRTPERHPNYLVWLSNLGASYEGRFERLGELADLDQAIQSKTQAVQLTPDGHPDKPGRLNNLGISYQSRFKRLGELADLNQAIQSLTQAVQLTPDGHPDKPGTLNNLGVSYLRRFERLGKLADLDQAIQSLTQAVQLTPDGHPDKPGTLNNLGISYSRRFERLGELADLDQGIQSLTQAVQLTPNDHPDKPGRLNNLGNSYQSRFKRLGKLADLDQAIQSNTQAVQLTPDGHPDKPGTLNNLGVSYQSRFERLGELADLDQAIQSLTQAVQLTPDGHPDKPGTLNNLGISYEGRFERLGELADLDQAIQSKTQAVQLTPDGHPDKPTMLNNLGISYVRRFKRLGGLADLDQAIQSSTQAVQLTPDGHPDKPGTLNNLGNSYSRRFERLGELADLDQAIQSKTQAVQLTPDGHPDKPTMLNNLGISYVRRFERLGGLADLDQGIQSLTQAVQLTPDGHPDKPGTLNNLGVSYLRRFERLGELADLDQGIQSLTQAVQLTPDGHPDKPTTLNNLGNSYMRRFKHLGELADLDQAIQSSTQAVQLTPDGHPDKPGTLNNLGNSYLCRFERLGELADLDQAIQFQSQAVGLTPDGHRHKPTLLNQLGVLYDYLFKTSTRIEDLQSALSSFQHATQLPLTSPQIQLTSARKWATACKVLGLSPQQAYERSIELIPHVVWLGATIDRRYDLLTSVSDLAAEAASWAIFVQSYDLAIEWLEQGRSIVWNQILQLRTPLDDLSVYAPALAQRFKDIASQLEHAASRPVAFDDRNSTPPDLEEAAQHHRRLAADWEKCLAEARNLPGFANFMRPRKAAELKTAATAGPVILINTHSKRWDALIIFPQCEDVAHLPLLAPPPQENGQSHGALSLEYVPAHRGGSERGFVKKGSKPEDPLKVELVALWKVVVKPILDALACTRKLPVDMLPHVTWCATGSLAFAPLHAAGEYDGSSPNALDLVISSYTPSLSALLASSTPSTWPDIGVLAIGQEATRGLPRLPYTRKELEAINQHAQRTNFLQLDGANATVQAVLSAMEAHNWVHLACHASQNSVNPSRSAFHLHDGQLTLEAITRRQFKNKGLAFLSACQTAKGDGKMPDEAVHLAAGMLMAGYPSVIATMWSIHDIDGPEVAGRVYAELKAGGMDHRGAAKALHKAVVELREKIGVDAFKRWVPFIHIGV